MPESAAPSVEGFPESPLAPKKRKWVFGIIAMALMMMAVDGTIVATALDELQRGLDTTVNWVGWTITAYACAFVIMLPVTGKLSIRIGNRPVFLASIIAFTLASLLCGLATNIYALIALRALQAAGGAGFTPAATGLIVEHFGDARDRAVGLFGSIFPMGAMLGPVLGGFIVAYWGWRFIFLVNVPIGMVVTVLVLLYVPKDLPKQRDTRPMDRLGLVILGLGLSAGMFAVTELGEADISLTSVQFWLPMAASLVLLALLLRRIRRYNNPVIQPRLLYGQGFGAVNLINIIFGGGVVGMLVLIPLYATSRYGMPVINAGSLLVAQGFAAIIFSTIAAFALRYTGYRLPLYIGACLSATGLFLLGLAPPFDWPPFAWLAGAAFLIGMGGGVVNPASRNAGLQLAPKQAPGIAALRSMCMQVGKISSISVVTAILAGASLPGDVQAKIYMAMAVILIVALPLISRLPEHHGAW